MDHKPTKSPKVTGVVSINDIMEFFVDYVKNDNLGQIANAHLAIVDSLSQNVFDLRCIKFAELHLDAVGKSKRMLVQPELFRISLLRQ